MRKKTVNHVADTIFWYVLYFLPIISYLLFCFTEPTTSINNNVNNDAVYSSYSCSTYMLEDSDVLTSGDYVFNNVLTINVGYGRYELSFQIDNVDYSVMIIDATSSVVRVSQGGTSIPVEIYSNGWINVNYQKITILADYTYADNSIKTFFTNNLTFIEPEPEPDIPIEPTLNIVPFYDYMISTYQFTENNFIYTTISNLFGINGVFNLALDKGIYLYFSWFIGVYLMHLFVDFILFIPRLCHKWLKEFTQGD